MLPFLIPSSRGVLSPELQSELEMVISDPLDPLRFPCNSTLWVVLIKGTSCQRDNKQINK